MTKTIQVSRTFRAESGSFNACQQDTFWLECGGHSYDTSTLGIWQNQNNSPTNERRTRATLTIPFCSDDVFHLP